MIIAIDFDGTICKRNGIPRKDEFSQDLPKRGAKVGIEFLISLGHKPYVLTARRPRDWPLVLQWLEKHKFPLLEITNKKKFGTKVIIDDRAIRITTWTDICKYFG